ncbi:MAG: hypothetical protein AAF682_26565 [Planctomycetota bacterium]
MTHAQATLLVPQDHPTIQGAITAAVDGDTVLVSSGTYVEQLDLLGKAITLRSAAGAATTTIDSQGLADWLDYPLGPVIRMVSGEGPSTVVEGFTITGGQTGASGTSGHAGVFCVGLSPTVRDCVITGNSGGDGGAVHGDATLERCFLTDNDAMPYGRGGAVFGAPTMIDCVVTGNRSGDRGGGIYATAPCTILRTVIDSNIGGNGADGYTGGGVFGPATLIECQITRNTAYHYLSGGPPDEIGTAVDGAAALLSCTIAGNRIGNPIAGFEDVAGAVQGSPVIENTILWDNQGGAFADFAAPVVSWSLVEGGWPGTGVISGDPLFVDPDSGVFELGLGSPAIDAGNPASPLDPDGTVADLGSLPFTQVAGSATPRFGSGVNPACYTTGVAPALGQVWSADVDVTQHGFSVGLTVVLATAQPVTLPTAFGELLIDPALPVLLNSTAAPTGTSATHAIPFPPDLAFVGVTVPTQAVVLGAAIGLCNALDLTLGTF